jgi:protein-disulfide isomerase
MLKRHTLLGLALALITSLLTGMVANGAQIPDRLTETFTWDDHDLTISYPATWVAVDNGTTISIHPADRDVNDGYGPELVLFEATNALPDDLEAALNDLAANSGATPENFVADRWQGRPTLTAPLVWENPAAHGSMRLIALDDQSVIGAAYVVRAEDGLAYTAPLVEIMESITFGADGSVQVGHSSVSVASVRLADPVAWNQTGLVLHFPEEWEIELELQDGDETIVAVPGNLRGDNRYHIIQATTIPGMRFFDLRDLVEVAVADYELISDVVDTTIAGYPAVVYDIIDTSEGYPLHLRSLMIDIEDANVIGLVVFATRESAWEDFLPIVSAVAGSIDVLDRGRAGDATGSHVALVAQTATGPFALPPLAPPLQDGDLVFTWEETGATFTLPDGWVTQNGDGQDYDMALISPEARQTGSGTFIKMRFIPMLGSSQDALSAALQPIAEQVEAETQVPYEIAGLAGAGIDFTDADSGLVFHFLLLPYGKRGDALYIQTTATADSDATVIDIVKSMELDIPIPDYAAADAAWQASLVEDGTLTVGDPDAPLKLVEYLSFTCSHCLHYSRSMERLIALDVETGRVQLTMAMLGGDEYATNATFATYCAAEQGKGFSTHEALFQGYADLGYDVAYTRDGINDLLSDFDLDMDALNACIDDLSYADQVDQTRLAFTDLGLTGTPTVTFGIDDESPTPIVFPDGQVWSGTIPLHWVRAIVDAYINEGVTPTEFVTQ